MKKYIFISITIIGILLVLFSSLGITQELNDADTVDAMLPPCTVENGVPFVGEDEVTCYWGMSGEVLEIPAEAIAANVGVEISWTKSGVWIGIAEASEADKCELKGDYYECQKESVNMIAGGPNSNGEITWQPTPGEYRFVAGGDDSQTLQQFDVEWNYQASLKSTFAIALLIIGLTLTISGAIFWYRTVKN
ncbi:MAG TPA: hypothetical protein HA354_04145 [Candidatus Poseidoniaceae archaeon]|nr:MAG TPA: hypothetical protein D7I07_04110 [Candidatus Poseidoniales archaeon]HII37669.1 hypothetical protein [Candidatus Poseidoniaceae archaeon]|tara:strand:- start:3391 stop:3966 length:576 start_codon:yes stop_codon:yes gene_type:complete